MEKYHVELDMLQSDHVNGMSEEEYAEVKIQVSTYVTKWFVPYSWNGLQLKDFLANNHPFKPSAGIMRLIFHAKTIENADSLELLAKSKRGTPTIYIIDSTITIPNQKENDEVKEEKDQIKEENKKPEEPKEPKVRMIKKRVSKRKQARIREEFMKKLELPNFNNY